MVMARHVFRFTIGQSMAVVAALAVIFAILPMRAAVAFALLATLLFVLRRNPRSNPALRESIGCLSCIFGFLGGVIVGAMWGNPPAGDSGLPIVANAFCYGMLGVMVAAIVGHFVALILGGRPSFSADRSEAKHKDERVEIELVERLLVQAEEQNDEAVRMKLAAYKTRLEQELSQ